MDVAIARFVKVIAAIQMGISLYSHQKDALEKLHTGSILCGGVGTGKSRTALAYFLFKECEGSVRINGDGELKDLKYPKDLYIITTARKRDSLEWEEECSHFCLSKDRELSFCNVKVTIDSWNNISKYTEVKDSFFIFDEQRVVGYGTWAKSFIKISKNNAWILLSATPADTWLDYMPVFIANGFYKNKTEFVRRHVVYNNFSKFPKVDHYIEVGHLIKLRNSILVNMFYERHTVPHTIYVSVDYDKELMNFIWNKRWNPYYSKPLRNISDKCALARRCVNTDISRLDEVKKILEEKKKVIIFYNFDYELFILRELRKIDGLDIAEWNGHIHEEIPKSDNWAYLVQYSAGAEGWNCVETNTIIFYSQNYSYRMTEQASGRIDRLNTKYIDLYYYHLKSNSIIDTLIYKVLKNKKNFNESSVKDLF